MDLARETKHHNWGALAPAIPALLVGAVVGLVADSWMLAISLGCGVSFVGVAVEAIGEKIRALT
jgi:uncharacterized membrane protein YoaK (UPF0700 family)